MSRNSYGKDYRPADAISIIGTDHVYEKPRKMINSEALMKEWTNSEAYNEYLGFVKAMNMAVRGKSNSFDCYESDVVKGILNLLTTLNQYLDDTPPIAQPQRFGNRAFKMWYEKVQKEVENLLRTNLPCQYHNSIVEIAVYLVESFGNSTRIDYGTGHEMFFCIFLYCLFKIGAFKSEDSVAVICRVFKSYVDLVRRLQVTYRMEPAGSHGVWSLDDYQFLPFIWGSAQFMNRPVIEPNMFLQDDIVKKYSSSYLFIGCIEYINKVKTGHFSEHSNQLWNISGLSTWEKINTGLIKMYTGEVLNKFPVIQHVVFGTLLRFVPFKNSIAAPSEEGTFKKPVMGDG